MANSLSEGENISNSKIVRFVKWILLGTVFMTPLVFHPHFSQCFATPKYYFAVITISLAAAIYFLEFASNEKIPVRIHPALIPVFLFLATQALSLISIDSTKYSLMVGLSALFDTVFYALLFFLVLQIGDVVYARKLNRALLISAGLTLIYGFFQYFGIDFERVWEIPWDRMKMFSTLGNVNWFGEFLVVALPVSIITLLFELSSRRKSTDRSRRQEKEISRWERYRLIFLVAAAFLILIPAGGAPPHAWIIAALLIFLIFVFRAPYIDFLIFINCAIALGILMTFSRGAWLACILSISFLFFALYFPGISGKLYGVEKNPAPDGEAAPACRKFSFLTERERSIAVRLILTGLLFLLVVFNTSNPLNRNPDHNLFKRFKLAFVKGQRNVSQRLLVWNGAYELFRESPWLGKGVGMFKVLYLDTQARLLEKPEYSSYIGVMGNAREAHNEYIQTLAESGVIGLVAFLFMIFSMLYYTFEIYCTDGEEENALVALGYSSAFLALMLQSLVGFPLRIATTAICFYLLPGLGAAMSGRTRTFKPGKMFRIALGAPLFIFSGLMFYFAGLRAGAADYYLGIGSFELKNHSFQSARELLSKAVSLDPNRGEILYLLGTSYIGLGQIDTGEALVRKALRFTNDKGIHNNLGFVALRRGRPEEAIVHFKKSWELDRESIDTTNNVGTAYRQLGKYREAIEWYRRALSANPYYLTAMNNLGDVYLLLNEDAEAKHYFSRVFRDSSETVIKENYKRKIYTYNQNSIGKEYGRAFFGLGEVAFRARDYPQAVEHFSRASEYIPDMPNVHYRLASSRYFAGELEGALASFRRARELAGESSEIGKKAGEAIAEIEKTIRGRMTDSTSSH